MTTTRNLTRSCFIEFPDVRVMGAALVALYEDSPTGFTIQNITEWNDDDGVSVFFTLAVGDIVLSGYEGESEFLQRCEALGGTYTGS